MNKDFTLVADIGNTSAHLALCRGERIFKELRLQTDSLASAKPKIVHFIGGRTISRSALASVVPSAARILQKVIQVKTGTRCFQIGKDIAVPVRNRARYPKQVGIDRLLNSLAAFRQLNHSAIVVDFGTAITFDVVSAKGEYLGGVIAPGIEITLDALNNRTALLPKIKLEHPKARIGRDTVECIRIGSSVGIGGLCDRIIEEISKSMKGKPVILATGGYASFMSRYSKYIRKIEPHLTLQGILLCLQK